ncbi:MAG: bifunctional (p)ppGpp synthetase/guanosine-3',5'-bis(diphosphate) 3'-pyrophosphohydrolase, partial [Deltaproteobacteria bacterium]|nr:bifunctional (p)ppGpp synthetase/guanosine-3',5'-bis(diphosphate) 3'-pyrophosphohydrolase [Deltaproteobacteria bacterium]
IDVVKVLTRHRQCLVEQKNGWLRIVREDFSSPIARMWLFGIITSIELDMKWHIQKLTDAEWRAALTPDRIAGAQSLLQERQRRKQTCDLLDCLQLADLLTILLNGKGFLSQSGFKSKNAVKRVFNDLEMLRNYLAHSQRIGHESWASIARLARHIE